MVVPPPTPKIPLTIVTGYLGSGKTTLMNRILDAQQGAEIAVLVNDFGSISIDEKILAHNDDQIERREHKENVATVNQELKQDPPIRFMMRSDMIETIGSLVNSEDAPKHILIEASGVSDSQQIVVTLNRSQLRNDIGIDSIIVVVDSEQFFLHEGNVKRLVHDQIRLADVVILNKADLVTKTEMANVRASVEEIVNRARIFETQEADVPIQVLMSTGTYNPQTAFDTMRPGVHAHTIDELDKHKHGDHSLVFATWAYEIDDAIPLENVRAALDELPRSIFRAKGVLYIDTMPDAQIEMQLVGQRVTIKRGRRWRDDPKTSITLIGDIDAMDKRALQATFDKYLRSGRAVATAADAMQDGVLRWVRTR